MSMSEQKPVEVYYNSACPLCDAGVREQRGAMEKAGAAGLAWTDMNCAPDALQAEGLTLDHVRRHLYARDASGRLHRGADAFAVLWRATPGRRWVGRLISAPVVRPVARAAYDFLADRLYAWNKRHRRW